MKADRQELIDDIARYVDRTIAGDPPAALIDEDLEPLLGMSTLRYLRVKPEDVLAGLYVGGLRDNSDVNSK